MIRMPVHFKYLLHNPLPKFLIIGVLSTIINYSLFIFLHFIVFLHYQISFIVGYLSGIAVGYLFNRSWSFQFSKSSHKRNIWKYLTVYVFSLWFGSTCLGALVNVVGIAPAVANLFTLLVTTFINYIGVRFWVFRI
jgi:putative flippase GtrA